MHKQWRLKAQFGEEKKVIADIKQIFSVSDLYIERVEDMMTAVAEACLNAFEHGNRLRADSQVCVHMNWQDNVVCIRIYDEGTGFEYTSDIACQRLENPSGTSDRGWGMLIISNLADKASTGFEQNSFFLEMSFYAKERTSHVGKSIDRIYS